MNKLNPRVTMIMGAGAVLDMNFPADILWPSTPNITQEVIKPYVNVFDENKEITIVGEIYKRLMDVFPVRCYNRETEPKPNIHFEMLFHVMEQLLAYESVWKGTNKNPNIYPYFAPFTTQNFEFQPIELRQVMNKFILRIMEIVNAYNEYFQYDKGAEDWFRDFFKSNFKWDVFSLNYDTTVEQSLGEYEDGFEKCATRPYSIFRPQKLYENAQQLSTVNHVHGCINYFYKCEPNDDMFETNIHDLYLYASYEEVKKKMIGRGQSNPSAQNNEQYYAGPIITGLRKTDKLNCLPYDFYHGNLYNAILRSNAMVIVGYSFGDLYVNNLINRMHAIWRGEERIVLIDKWDDSKINGYKSLLEQYMFTLSRGEIEFMEIMSSCTDIRDMIDTFIDTDVMGPQYSQNGNLLLFTCGMKEASRSRDKIYNFLES